MASREDAKAFNNHLTLTGNPFDNPTAVLVTSKKRFN